MAAVFLVLMIPLLIDFIRFQRKRARIKENTQRKHIGMVQERSRPCVFFVQDFETAKVLPGNASYRQDGSNGHVSNLTDHYYYDVRQTVNEKPKKKKKSGKAKKKKKKRRAEMDDTRASGLESSMDDGGFRASRHTGPKRHHSGKKVSPFDNEDDMGEYLEEIAHRSREPEPEVTPYRPPLPAAHLLQESGHHGNQYTDEQILHAQHHTPRQVSQTVGRHPGHSLPQEFHPQYGHHRGSVQGSNAGIPYQVPTAQQHPVTRPYPIEPNDPRLYPSQQLHGEQGAYPDTLGMEERQVTSPRAKTHRPLPPRPAQTKTSTNMVFKASRH